MKLDVDKFFRDQLSTWSEVCARFRQLKQSSTRVINLGGLDVTLQCNPARIVSTAAKIDVRTPVSNCFLCAENRPKAQSKLPYEGRKGKKYDILINPFPIFDRHLTIASGEHVPQGISSRYVDMLDLAAVASGYTIMYNGPRCGASAPMHHHFQAVPCGIYPLENDVRRLLDKRAESRGEDRDTSQLSKICRDLDARLYHYGKFLHGIFVIKSRTVKSAAKLFYRLLDCAPHPGDLSEEPMFNLISFMHRGFYVSVIVFRTSHRSHHYSEPADSVEHLTMSPGCADVMGTLIMPVTSEFERATPQLIGELLSEVTLSERKETKIIERLTRKQLMVEIPLAQDCNMLSFEILSDGAGLRTAFCDQGKVNYGGTLYDELYFDAPNPDKMFSPAGFMLVTALGTRKYPGALKISVEDGSLKAVNVVGVEDYLLSSIATDLLERVEQNDARNEATRQNEEGRQQKLKQRLVEARTEALNGYFKGYVGLNETPSPELIKAIDATWGIC